MKIVVASKGNPNDIKTWSGIPYYIYKALTKKGHDVYGINLLAPAEPWYYALYKRVYYKLRKKWLWVEMEPYYLKKMAKQFDDEVNAVNPDLVILIHGHFLAYTTFKHHTVVVHDTTFAQIIDYYSDFRVLTPRSIYNGNAVYQRGLDRATAAVFSSSWASQSALSDYTIDPVKIHTIPFGANLSRIPKANQVEQWIWERTKTGVCNFLFLGIDWERKGGPDALRFIVELNRMGISSYLNIVGCYPKIPESSRQYVNRLGFLRKNVDEEARKLEALFVNATALLLPSLAECFGCVYCEANAYGLPALGRDTGGVPEAIRENVNGLLMKPDETPEAFAQRWAGIWRDSMAYARLSECARREFAERLNYDVFTDKLVHIIGETQGEPALPA